MCSSTKAFILIPVTINHIEAMLASLKKEQAISWGLFSKSRLRGQTDQGVRMITVPVSDRRDVKPEKESLSQYNSLGQQCEAQCVKTTITDQDMSTRQDYSLSVVCHLVTFCAY